MSFEIKRARGKTAVFSGTRHHSSYVPRLEDLCIQKLLDNANKIECVGDVPYYILEPLLKKVTLAQLKQIESYNPQLVDDPDSDKPWKQHCKRHFEGRKPREGESWRDMFIRCERERDHKIDKIAKRIRKHEEKAVPARQTRVVEQQPSGGRNRAMSATTVIKKTIRNHIPIKGEASSSSSRPTTATTTSTVVIRRDAHNGSTSSKTKHAPLMQKSLQLFKSRFRR
uniref:Transcription elongation factor B polypeptide 3 n=1 Tax=Aceria tosichella TaxID=561515 RepID=A0A6G1SPA5_9ACAR